MSNVVIFNTGETSEELREKYNPDGSILRKAQLRMLDMLLYLDEVCQHEHIPYRIDAGNVLGAIRHGGFVPWDDDVDIVLLRKDYKKLCRYLKCHPHPQFVLQSFSTDHGYVGAWSVLRDLKSEYIQDSKVHNARKYRGLQVDIFPYENRIIPFFYKISDRITRKNQTWFIGRLPLLARFIYIVQHYFIHPIFRMIGNIIKMNDSTYGHSYGASFPVWHSKNSLFPHKPLNFENHQFPGPANPDQYLKEHYGDYMKLPPISNRQHHQAKYRIWE